ncbi:hypothetical protein BD289DRAFT_53750 [Coniella lustricola]|uniref:Uncharacterized protein n=1 Tax=Coniella lustricola TaxID=2025994 RepID=A0A2T3A0Y1_9PEZI|nr:hypothetical protein BD289DRAFT_53750 [Coniella lustricola]
MLSALFTRLGLVPQAQGHIRTPDTVGGPGSFPSIILFTAQKMAMGVPSVQEIRPSPKQHLGLGGRMEMRGHHNSPCTKVFVRIRTRSPCPTPSPSFLEHMKRESKSEKAESESQQRMRARASEQTNQKTHSNRKEQLSLSNCSMWPWHVCVWMCVCACVEMG